MSKNVIEATAGIVVQDELYNEILNGFQNEGGVSCKKTLVVLSPIQKKRVPLVAESFFANEKSKPFLNEWISNLKGSLDENKLLNGVQLEIFNKLKRQKQDIEDEIEEEDDGGKGFNILNSFRLIRFINIIGDIANTFNKIKEFNQTQLDPIVNDIKIIQVNDKLTHQMKQALLIGKLQKLMYGILSPILPQVFRSIKNFYDNEKVSRIIKEFIEEIKTQIEIEIAISAALYVASAVITYFSGGLGSGSFAAAAAINAARFGKIGLQIARLGKNMMSARKIYKGAGAAYKGIKATHKTIKSTNFYRAASAINSARKKSQAATSAYDFFHLSEDELREFASDIRNFQNEKIVPFVNDSNVVFDNMQNAVDDFETFAYDYTLQKARDYLDIEKGLGEVRKNIDTVNDLLKDKSLLKGGKIDTSKYETQQTVHEIDFSNLRLKERQPYELSNVGNYVYSRSERIFNLIMTPNVHAGIQKMHFYNNLRMINDTIYESFGNISVAVSVFINSIKTNYKQMILNARDSVKIEDIIYIQKDDGSKEQKYIVSEFKNQLPYVNNNYIDWMAQATYYPTDEMPEVWSLNDNTLTPFQFLYTNYAVSGFVVSLKVQGKNSLRYVKYSYPNLQLSLKNEDDKKEHKEYFDYFATIEKNKNIIPDELEAEKELYGVVDGLLSKIRQIA